MFFLSRTVFFAFGYAIGDAFRMRPVEPCVVLRRDSFHPFLERRRHVQMVDEIVNRFFGDFEGLVRMWEAFGQEDGLDGFRDYGPVVFQILFKAFLVQ